MNEQELQQKIQHAKDMQDFWKGKPELVQIWVAVERTYEEFLKL